MTIDATHAPDAAPSAATPKRRSLGPNYRKVYIASVISNLGDGVDLIGYPWLASAVTRNPVLFAIVGVAQRLPWLLFTLPAGVITDRVDRRRTMIVMDVVRGIITAFVAIAVLGLGHHLPHPDAVKTVIGTRTGLYLIVLLASMLLGTAQVLRENCAQTIIPAIVATEDLERANGRMWSMEQVANTFVGPPLGSLMIAAAFFLPFAIDSVSFFAAAGLVVLVAGSFRARPAPMAPGPPKREAATRGAWKDELKEGVRWLWHHPVLRPMAIILGCLNALGALQEATLVLFAQEVLRTSPVQFALLSMGAALGGIAAGYLASGVSRKLGPGPSLWLTLFASAACSIPIGLTSSWPVVFVMFATTSFFGIVWNVITVSLRQSVIPDHLLGRVNSVYRFFAWGMIPIGIAIGGVTVALVQPHWGRETALRAPWFVSAALGLALIVYAVPRLTTEKLEAVRAEGVQAKAEAAAATGPD